MTSRSRGSKARGLHRRAVPQRGSRECRVRAAPAVSCAKCTERNAHEHTGSAEAIRHSLRNGFTAYVVLSPATNSSCHRHRRIKGLVAPGRARKNLRRLDTSNGCQDHTVLPSASAPFVCALVDRSQVLKEPALRSRHTPTLPRPPHPRPNVRDDHDTPL
jgi:hypothetical protein